MTDIIRFEPLQVKRRFRMTITPTKNGESFQSIKQWVCIHWGIDFWNGDLLFGTRQKHGYIALLEVFGKTTKAL